MGLLLFLCPFLSWPICWFLFPGSLLFFSSPNEHSLLPDGRSNIECWILLIVAFTVFVIASPNLSSLRRGQIKLISYGFLVIQPFLLAFLRWPQLVETIWCKTEMWGPTILCCLFPGLLSVLLLNRQLGFNRLLWLPIASSSVMAFAVDMVDSIGIVNTFVRGGVGHAENAAFPWGLLLTIIVSAWLSSLLIPYWFLWCSQAQRLDDERSNEIGLLWNAFRHPSPKIYLWPTACRSSNAVLLGGLTRKKLLLTDKLLLTFNNNEIEWVVLHELSHGIRHHSLVRMLPTCLAIPSLLYLLACTQGVYLVLGCIMLGIIFAGLIVATCWWTEWDADTHAIKLGAKHHNLSLVEASTQYSLVLKKLYGANKSHRTSWTHPSLKQRLSVVDKLSLICHSSPS